MGLVVAVVVAFAYLDPPWRYLLVLGGVVWEGIELVIWWRYRNHRSITGAEAIVGARGRALSDCRPDGQVRVRGRIWQAHCPDGVDEGDDVTVTAMRGLQLDVAPARGLTPPAPPP